MSILTNILKILLAVLAVAVIGYIAIPHLGCLGKPERQKLADCSSNTLAFALTCHHSPPYQFVLGLDSPPTGALVFRGEVIIQQSTGTVSKIQISSDQITSCNWLPGLDGYILTWHRTNAGERHGEMLHHGQSYDVRVTFSPPPPTNSSLWFTSLGKAKWW